MHCRLTAEARHHRCLRMPLQARSSIRRPQSPSQLQRHSARLRMTRVMSEVTPRCRTFAQRWHAATRFAIMVLCGLVQVPAAASSSARDLFSHATRPEHQLPSYAWLDTTELIAVDSNRHTNQHDEASDASSLARTQSRRPALTISAEAAEPSRPSGLSDSTVAGL